MAEQITFVARACFTTRLSDLTKCGAPQIESVAGEGFTEVPTTIFYDGFSEMFDGKLDLTKADTQQYNALVFFGWFYRHFQQRRLL